VSHRREAPRRRAPGLLVGAVAAAGAALYTWATSFSLGFDIDSAAYIGAVRSLVDGHGLALPTAGGRFSFTRWPPLFPAAIAAIAAAGVDAVTAARLLNGCLLVIMIGLIGWTVHRATGSTAVAVLAAILLLRPAASLTFYAVALSEPLSMVLGTAALVMLAGHLRQPSMTRLGLVALLLAASCAARYSSVAYLLATAGGVVLLGAESMRRRLRDAAVLTAVTLVPTVAWLVHSSAGSANTDRKLVWHPIPVSQLTNGFAELVSWILPRPIASRFASGPVALVAVIVLAVVGARVVRLARRARRPIRDQRMTAVCAMFLLCYVVFVVASISVLDAGVVFGGRTLAPLYPPALLIALPWGHRWLNAALPRHMVLGRVAMAAVTCFALVTAATAVDFARDAHRDGIGLATRERYDAEVLEAVRRLPEHLEVLSNEPSVVYLLTGRAAGLIPRLVEPGSLRANASFADELSRQRDLVAGGRVVVVWLDQRAESVTGFPSEGQVRDALGLCVTATYADGRVYRGGPCD
jgi:hypothetical protein